MDSKRCFPHRFHALDALFYFDQTRTKEAGKKAFIGLIYCSEREPCFGSK